MSWGAYLLSAAVLVAAISPSLAAVASASTESALAALTQGTALLLEGVVPGVSVTFSYGSVAQGTTVRIGGFWVNGSAGGMVVPIHSDAQFRPATLVPGRVYIARVAGGMVLVAQAV